MTNKELYGTDNVPKIPKKYTKPIINLLEENLTKVQGDNNDYLMIKVQDAIQFWKDKTDENI